MKALILAAGRGRRLRPLTDVCPKPLLPVRGHRLWDWQLAALKKAGVTDVVVNTAHLAQAFEAMPAVYAEKGLHLTLSREGETEEAALETLGGIVKALPLLTDGEEPFLVAAGDVTHDFPMTRLMDEAQALRDGRYDAVIVAVPNPDFHRSGDLTVASDGRVTPGAGPHTYGCLMLAAPRIFRDLPARYAKLFPWLWTHARVKGVVWEGFWANVGDPTELAKLSASRTAALLVKDF